MNRILDFGGWVGPPIPDNSNRDVLNGMLSHSGRPEKSLQFATENQTNVALAANPVNGFLFQTDQLMLAITGKPKWNGTTLFQKEIPTKIIAAITSHYKSHGRAVLNRLSGDFALAILEPNNQRALLAIDRIGIGSLAFTNTGDSFIFATSQKALLKHPSVTPIIDNQGVFSYLYFHMIPSPGSIYQGLSKLLPGECIEFNNGKVHRSFYWRPTYHESPKSEHELASKLKSKLDEVVKDYVDHRHATGTFLSGGLDSSTITGVFREQSERKTDAFSIGFEAHGYDEMEFARASAKHFDVNLYEYYVTADDVIDAIPLVTNCYDEPFGNASAVPTYYCAKLAKDHGKSRLLAGDGGDEIFAGNERYVKQKIFELYEFVPTHVKSIIEPIAFNVPYLRKVKSYINQAKVPMPDRLQTYNFLHRTPIEQVLHGDFLKTINAEQPVSDSRAVYGRAQTSSFVKKMLFLDMKYTLADNDLRKVTAMCEAAGIEVGYPLLHESIVDFAAQVPSNLLMRRFELRSFFRRAYGDFLAPKTLTKSKHGFGLPFGLWLNTHTKLKEFTQESLNNLNQRGILNTVYLDDLISRHQAGHGEYYGVMIWILIILEQWFQTHFDNQSEN